MHLPDWAKLAGIPIVLIGLALRLKPTLVVVLAALVTGLLAGLPLLRADATHPGVIDMLGKAFTDNRLMTLFIITLPAIALSERFGLQRQAAHLIRQFRAATVARLLIVYQIFRVLMGMLGLRVNGHPTFVRPLVYPMLLGASPVNTDAAESIKPPAAAAENYGNFYGQNLSPVQPGILLVYGVLKGLGYPVSVWKLVLYAIPITAISVVLGALQFALFSRRLARHSKTEAP
jgi:uncharacterized membrane protein